MSTKKNNKKISFVHKKDKHHHSTKTLDSNDVEHKIKNISKRNKLENSDDDNPNSDELSRTSEESGDNEEYTKNFNENSDEPNNDQINKKINIKPNIKYNTNTNVNKKKVNSDEIFKELIRHQLPNVPTQWKLNINDMKRICKYIDTSIFDKDYCCIWNGYITNMNNSNKGTYVNFYFRNKKVALHRLLYSNFVAPLDSSEYLKFNCDNKGICCNINHYEKYKYSKNNGLAKKETKHKEPKKEIKDITIVGSDDPEKLIIKFD
ncbi:MAG: hypothetical protein Satyrvirus4_18 [Satyrvirus sp.]|uniref:Uncharacterized protein n=1 Tax=Satyrvirus sp. TaxID=2487771 RepID=A0A3G5AFS3_9VIRU|nr:MAG: hypothetical protein Satyrvirus4_18 [Satyrvirus sp.]